MKRAVLVGGFFDGETVQVCGEKVMMYRSIQSLYRPGEPLKKESYLIDQKEEIYYLRSLKDLDGGVVSFYVFSELKTPFAKIVDAYKGEPTVPAGWRLVPEESTGAMRLVLLEMLTNCHSIEESYAELLAAAPTYTGEKE